ncbi:MAG: ribonuclease P protein component [bacterium]|nr:ribonuclease P protein component [bacterium]
MLDKKHRLTKKQFSEVFMRGSMIRSGIFMCKVLKDPSFKGLFAVSVPKKEVKTAVMRNKIRRRVYSAIRKASTLDKTSNSDFVSSSSGVFIAGKVFLDMKFEELVDGVSRILSKMR